MGKEKVPIVKITCQREPGFGPPDDLAPLRASIEEFGLLARPLVDENYQLIDGARRLAALREMGHTEVDVVVSRDYDFSITNLRRAHKVGLNVARPVTLRRVYEIYSALTDQRTARGSENNSKANRARWSGKEWNPATPSRDLLVQALGLSSSGIVQAAIALFRAWEQAADEDREVLAGILRETDLLQISAHSAEGAWLRHKARRPGSTANAVDQATILANTATTLTGVVRATMNLGPISPTLKQADLARINTEISAARTHLHRLSAAIRKAMGQQ